MDRDTRNVIDEFRGKTVDEIKSSLDSRRKVLEIAIENLERDFNMGTIVRSANAFNVRAVHIIGKKQWNKRGAMVTDRYMNVFNYKTVDEFIANMKDKHVIGIDNVSGSQSLNDVTLPKESILVFGSERSGLSDTMISACEKIVSIEQFGSTRSINVGVAAGIVMYTWLQRHELQ